MNQFVYLFPARLAVVARTPERRGKVKTVTESHNQKIKGLSLTVHVKTRHQLFVYFKLNFLSVCNEER